VSNFNKQKGGKTINLKNPGSINGPGAHFLGSRGLGTKILASWFRGPRNPGGPRTQEPGSGDPGHETQVTSPGNPGNLEPRKLGTQFSKGSQQCTEKAGGNKSAPLFCTDKWAFISPVTTLMAYETFRAKLGFVSVVPILITEGAIRGERKTLQAKKHPWGSVHDKNTKKRAKTKKGG
jgi:hypothetical protein